MQGVKATFHTKNVSGKRRDINTGEDKIIQECIFGNWEIRSRVLSKCHYIV